MKSGSQLEFKTEGKGKQKSTSYFSDFLKTESTTKDDHPQAGKKETEEIKEDVSEEEPAHSVAPPEPIKEDTKGEDDEGTARKLTSVQEEREARLNEQNLKSIEQAEKVDNEGREEKKQR